MSLIGSLLIGNNEVNIIPLTYLDNLMKMLADFINNPAGEF